MGQHYKEIAAIALKRRADAIPKEFLLPEIALTNLPRNLTTVPKDSGHFTPEELEIIDSDAEDLLLRIKERRWSAVAVTRAFCKSSTVAQQLTNCVTEILFPEALARAKYLDEHLEKTGQVIGPLHGLPISLKDCMITPPHPSSIGMACYANEPTTQETILVGTLAKLGAIFYVKTNVPTAMMMMETINVVWGETIGPYHSGTSCGGSSGGEGALLAMKGNPLGIGTDIGGSIRIPSSFNGLYGLKPSFGRFPVFGTLSGITGQDYIFSNNGPMSRSLGALQLYCRAVLSDEVSPWNLDSKCVPVPWREEVIQPKGRKLRFGIVSDNDGAVSVQPPISRGLAVTKKALEAAGHEVFDFHTLGAAAILDLTLQNGEPVYGSMANYEATYKKGEHGTLGPTKLREMIMRRNAFQKVYLDRWNSTATDEKGPMDAIIIPASPWSAPRLGLTQTLFNVSFTGAFNILDNPSCTFPVTFADKDLDARRAADWKPLNELDGKIQEDYDPEFYHGTPVTLQCVGRRLEEEKVLEMVSVIAEALKF